MAGTTLALATTVTLPRPEVIDPTLDNSTGRAVPQAPCPQVPLPQPLMLAITYCRELLLARF